MKQKKRIEAEIPDQGMWRRYGKYLLPAAAVLLMLAAYSNSFEGLFVMDNAEMVRDTRIHAATSEQVHRILTQRFWEGMGDRLYRPLTTLTFLFNYAVLGNGTRPEGYHWFNLILHALNMLLVYRLGMAVFERPTAAALLSAIWGLHPVMVESVTNVIGRSDMLAAFGVLAALLAHRNAIRSSGFRRAAWIGAVFGATAVGMFSKENAIVVIAIVVMWDLTFERGASWPGRILSYSAVVIPCVLYLWARTAALADEPLLPVRFVDNPLFGADFWTARLTAIKVIGRYAMLLIWPAGLSSDYSYNEVPLAGWGDLPALVSLAGCVAAATAAVRFRRENRPLSFFLAFCAIALSPVSNLAILIGTIMGERLVYLPAVGFAGCVVCGVEAAGRRWAVTPGQRRALAAGALAVCAALAIRTWSRNADWLDTERFWKSARNAAPGSYKTTLQAALNSRTAGDAASVREVERALATLNGLPDRWNVASAYVQAGTFYRQLGEIAASRRDANAEAWYGKSLEVLMRAEKIELAQDEATKQINAERHRTAVTSGWGVTLRELGRTYARLGDTPRALAAFERGRAVGADAELLEDAASIYRAQGEPRKAAFALVESLLIDANRASAMAQAVELYAIVDPGGCAVTRDAGGANLNPSCPLVHQDICAASGEVIRVYERRGQVWEANAIRQAATKDLGCGAETLGR